MNDNKNPLILRIAKLIATALGTGYTPKAPGTAGALTGTIFLYFINLTAYHYGATFQTIFALDVVLTLLITLAGVFSINQVHKIWQHDSGKIVIDEVAGVLVTLLHVPLDWRYYLAGFILFRIFDIAKPFYIKKIDRLNSSWSVMLDDIVAGIYGLLILQAFLLVI